MLKVKPDKAKKSTVSWQSVQDRNRKLPAAAVIEDSVAKEKASKAKAGSRWESEGGKTK